MSLLRVVLLCWRERLCFSYLGHFIYLKESGGESHRILVIHCKYYYWHFAPVEKKKSRGKSKHFTGKYTLALSHPHLEGKNKYLLRNGLKTFLLEYCFLGAEVDSHVPEPSHPVYYIFF